MEPNYFTCTLGQAAALGIQQPHKTVTAFIDAQAQDTPDAPAVGFPRPGISSEDEWSSTVFTFADIRHGSGHVASTLLAEHPEALSKRQTVALLCPSTPQFLFTWLALMRLGHAVLLIAPQCQPAAIASLCRTCQATMLFYDDVYEEQARGAAAISANDGEAQLEVIMLPFRKGSDKILALENGSNAPLPTVSVSEDEVAYLHHTSGTSSGMPKPIPQSHHAGVGVLPKFTEGHKRATFTTTPLYHGGVADAFRAWTSGALIWLFPGVSVPITATNIVKCLDVADQQYGQGKTSPVKYFASVPYVLQMLEANPRGLQYLQGMDIAGVGGAALPAEVGDRLVSKGINLISRFGSAECGFVMSSHRDYENDKDWQYLRVAPGVERYVRLEPQADDDLAELVVLSGWPHMAKRNREDGSFATSDLFAPHPSSPNAWRYHSRADSQLTLITGKKFDPAPLEASIATTELLDDVVIFGTGQPYPGILMFRSSQTEAWSDEEMLEQLWPIMEKLNSESQDHARISKTMLVFMPVLVEPLAKSSKGTLLRGAVEKRFAREIEGAYSQVDDAGDDANVPDNELPATIRGIITSIVAKKLELTDTTDLFSYGVDSVAGMRIRNQLRRLLPQDKKQLPINVVEDCGNVEKLAQYVRRRRLGETESNGDMAASEQKYMLELVQQYSKFTETRYFNSNTKGSAVGERGGEVVVLTGATGALGAHILDQCRANPNVTRIYCLVRGADEHAAHERVNKALQQRQLQTFSSEDPNDKIVVLQAQLGNSQLGLEKVLYDQLAREVTLIMHVAWSVNFRMKLRSFVKDNIAGVTNLINLALASPKLEPPRFAFCSSVASAMAYRDTNLVPEEVIQDPTAATGLGYSQSKWVAELICEAANATTRLKGRVLIYRVGQLAGDTKHGVWNVKEAWPMMLSAVKITGSLPALEDEKLDWLAVDVAATALIQGTEVMVEDGKLPVFHVLNDNSRPSWMELLNWLSKKEKFDVVSPSEWVEQLELAINEGSNHPSGQLLDHWRTAYGTEGAKVGDGERQSVGFAMAQTKEALPVLRSVKPVSEEYFGKLWGWITENM